MHNLHADGSGEWSYTYSHVGEGCEYSMAITNGAFFHKVYT